MKRIIAWSSILGILLGIGLGATSYWRTRELAFGKPNIIMFSICSLRKQELGLYSPNEPSVSPHIDQAFRSGLKLDQVYSSFGWTNLALYFLKVFDKDFLFENGYDVIDDATLPLRFDVRGAVDSLRPDQHVNHIQPRLQALKSRISLFRRRPFFAYVHVKYMHFPYMDEVNVNANWDRYLNEDERRHVERIFDEPQNLYRRIPLALTLSGRLDLLNQFPEYKPQNESDPLKIFFGLYNLMVDRTKLDTWASSEDYAKELAIMRKIYRAKLSFLDENLKEVLNLYDREDLLDNTILVLMGDHGEAFMEHGQLGHAMHVYDEVLSPPVLVRFPRSWRMRTESIQRQIFMGSLVDWLMAAVRGENSESDFKRLVVDNPKNQFVVSRNCPNTIHSIREDNKWKLIVDRVERQRMLFDLEVDPHEKRNIYDAHLSVAARLELELSRRLGDMDAILDPTPCRL